MKKVRVLITPRKGLLDPQGRAVQELLRDNGFEVSGVRVGKLIEMEVPDGEDVHRLVQRFIINPLIEEYEIEEL
jgi:phosphoribosylformylglycinamidine synthase